MARPQHKEQYWSEPKFNNAKQERQFMYDKFIKYMATEEIPTLPTRKQEIDYINYLEKSILTDPWITLRPKKHMAGPWRLYWKRKFEMRREYYKTFLLNALGTISLSLPLIFYFAKKRQYTPTGVPMTRYMPSDLFNPGPNVKLSNVNAEWIRNKYIRRTFYYGLFKYSVIAGFAGGLLFTDWSYFNNQLNSRPDLAQFRIMTDNVPDRERKVFEIYEDGYFGKQWSNKEGSWYKKLTRKLFPSVDYNHPTSYYLPPYDINKGYYPDDDVSYYYSK